MPDYLPIPRFPLPDDLTPEGTMCVVIRIPNDQQYLGTLIGLLDTLKWSKNFARDASGEGAAIVSRTWEAALEATPITIEDCDMPDFQINPETCLLEVNCGTDEEPNWQPVFTPGYDPTEDAPPVILYPDPPPTGESNECLAAENVTSWMRDGTHQFAILLSDYDVIGQIAALLYTLLSQLVSVVQANLWFTLLEVDWGSFDPEEIINDWTEFDWEEFKNLIVCYFEPDGSITPARHLEALDEMESHVGQIYRLIRLVWSLAGSIGISTVTRWAGITDGDCEVCVDFEHEFDFATACDDLNWSVIRGVVECDLGVRRVNTAGVYEVRICADGFPEREITYVDVGFETPVTLPEFVMYTNCEAAGDGIEGSIVGGKMRFPINFSTSELRIDMACLFSECGDILFNITDVTVAGQGTDPF